MPQYVQFNNDGFITATVFTEGVAPDSSNQLVFDPPVETTGKMVDTVTWELIDLPPEE